MIIVGLGATPPQKADVMGGIGKGCIPVGIGVVGFLVNKHIRTCLCVCTSPLCLLEGLEGGSIW